MSVIGVVLIAHTMHVSKEKCLQKIIIMYNKRIHLLCPWGCSQKEQILSFKSILRVALNNFYVCDPTSMNLIPHLVSKVRAVTEWWPNAHNSWSYVS